MKIQDLNLSDLKYFIDSVEHGSLARSAEINHISSAAISKGISRLGQWLGSPLLTHEKNVFQLTQQGEEFFRGAKAAYDQMNTVLVTGHSLEGEIRIGCSSSVVASLISPALKKLKSFERIKIRIGTSSQVRSLLSDGQINFGVVIDDLHDPDLQQEILFRGTFNFASVNGKVSDLLITTEDRNEVFAAKQYLRKSKLEFKRHIQVESWTAASQLARELSGVCLVPDFLMSKSLKPVFKRGFNSPYQILILHHGVHRLHRSESLLRDLIRSEAESIDRK